MDYECHNYSKPLTLLTSGQPVNICAPMVRYSRYLSQIMWIKMNNIIYTPLCTMQHIYYIHNVVQMQLISYARIFLELRIFSKVLCI